MEYRDDELGLKFEVVDRPTVRLQLLYKGAMGMSPGEEVFVRLWDAAKLMITKWECEYLELEDNIDKIDNPKAAEVIEFAGLAVYSHINGLEEIPKNS